MQRIDENTYIDDTLMTCAEYQLFIDEMREQGKYYQPDHWTSYQFPAGQALELILGVRLSDAKAFCDWLTQREEDDLQYRLLTEKEARQFPLKGTGNQAIGYWVDGNQGNHHNFVWVGILPSNSRALNSTRLRTSSMFINSARTFAKLIDGIADYDLNFEINRTINGIRNSDLEIELAVACALLINRDLDFGLAIVDAIERSRTAALDLDLDQTQKNNLSRDLEYALDRVVDIFTLQERIAGRSPAFEGIRLVKERIK